MTTLVLSILNGSSSFLHTIRTTIKAWMSLNFGKIPLLTSELAALECRKINEKNCDHSSSFIFDWIFFILAGNKLTHNISDGFEIQQDPIRDL